MAFKPLKEYGLKFKELKATCKLLNDSDLLAAPISIKVGVSADNMLSSFMDAVESIPDDKMADIPADVSTYYAELPQEVFDDAPLPEAEGVEEGSDAGAIEGGEDTGEGTTTEGEEGGDEISSDCPVFGTGHDEDEADCQTCGKDTKAEYDACVVASKAAKKKAKKGKAKDGAKKAPSGKRTCYGHMPGSMSGHIDGMVSAGASKADIIKSLTEEPFKREEAKAGSKLTAHLKRLTTKLGIEISEKKDGSLKATPKYAEGRNAENTVDVAPAAE